MRFTSLALSIFAVLFLAVNPAMAEEAAAAATSGSAFDGLAAAIAIALASLGGALAQGRATSAALEGIGRNPGAAGQMFTPMLLGLVLIESLVIYALVVALKLVNVF